jgi:hypothetical protein
VFLVEDKRLGTTNLVFTWENPQRAGYQGKIIEGVALDYNMEVGHGWSDGQSRPMPSLGRDPNKPKSYKVFKDGRELLSAGYEPVPGTPVVFGSWKDYLKLYGAEDLPDEDWYQELDRFDQASRLRRHRAQGTAPVTFNNRDEVAAWVAKKHLNVDSGIQEVWYLPQESPAEEIRLLELSDRFAGIESKAEPIDFGLDIEGALFRLFVADISSDEFDQIQHDPSRLPPGWSLKGSTRWRRGA